MYSSTDTRIPPHSHRFLLPSTLQFYSPVFLHYTSSAARLTFPRLLLVVVDSSCSSSIFPLLFLDLTAVLSSPDFYPHTRTCKCTLHAVFTHICLKHQIVQTKKVSTVRTPFLKKYMYSHFCSSPHASFPLHPECILFTMLHRSPLPIPPLLYSSPSPLLPLCVHLSGPCNSAGTSHLKPGQ